MPNTTAYSFGDVVLVPFPSTIEQRLILRKLGALQGDDVQALRAALRQILG